MSAKTALQHGTRRAAYHAMPPRCAAVGHSTTTPQISRRAICVTTASNSNLASSPHQGGNTSHPVRSFDFALRHDA
ncbi:hypothetical protein LA080_008984 [Diaporthe eres]|nr:hypothetical protein LA080_008984 [Diaporthe eres]